MTSATKAGDAARVYKQTQPAIDALKDTFAANAAAKKILGDYMAEHNLTIFRGVSLRIVTADAWDNLALHAFLGDKVAEFRRQTTRKYLEILKRTKRVPASGSPTPASPDADGAPVR